MISEVLWCTHYSKRASNFKDIEEGVQVLTRDLHREVVGMCAQFGNDEGTIEL